jgi:hypothetical protein
MDYTKTDKEVMVPATVYEWDELSGYSPDVHEKVTMEVYGISHNGDGDIGTVRVTIEGGDTEYYAPAIINATNKQDGHKLTVFVEDSSEYFFGVVIDHDAGDMFFIRPEYLETVEYGTW